MSDREPMLSASAPGSERHAVIALPQSRHDLARRETDDPLAAFRTACGLDRPLQVTVLDPLRQHAGDFVLDRPYAVIGRSTKCDLRLSHEQISFRHAYLQLIGGRVLCVDLDSRTGIQWRSERVVSQWLPFGEEISLGPYVIRLGSGEVSHRLDQPPPNQDGSVGQLLAPRGSETRLPDVSLEFCNGQLKSAEQRMLSIRHAVTLIGRSPQCKIRLQDDSISKVHASLVLTESGCWVADLLGRSGVVVNGQPVTFATLRDGDELVIGRFRMIARVGVPGGLSRRSLVTPTVMPPQPMPPQPMPPNGVDQAWAAFAYAASSSGAAPLPPWGPAAGAPAGFSESFVLSLVGQFAQMQQQMFAQSQQQMLLLTQMFGSMHQGQQELIREDLGRVHAITMEMQQLQAELLRAQMKQGAAPAPAASPNGRSDDPTASSAPPSAGTSPRPMLGALESHPLESATSDQPTRKDGMLSLQESGTATIDTAAPTTGTSADVEQDAFPSQPEDDSPLSEREPAGQGPSATTNAATVGESKPAFDEASAVDTCAWITERIGRLERERNSRWNRILQVLTGVRSRDD